MARDYKAKRGKSGGFSGWAGLFLGLLIGLAVAGIIYIKDHRPDAAAISTAKPDKKKQRGGELPDTESREAGAPDIRSVPETRRGTYVLQAGSYKNFADADRVRAQLALQGIESKVQKVSVDNDTWHRIRVGPISNLDELNRMRQILRKADVDVLVIRVGD
jgi:cell division protein FtsN